MSDEGIRVELTISMSLHELEILRAYAQGVLSDSNWNRGRHGDPEVAFAQRLLDAFAAPKGEAS